jgi:hypothetical protein
VKLLDLFHIGRSFAEARCPWLKSPPNKALATAFFPSGMFGRFLKPHFRAQHETAGFPMANDHNRPDSGPRLLMSQWPSAKGAQCRPWSYSVQHNTRAHGHKALPEQDGD